MTFKKNCWEKKNSINKILLFLVLLLYSYESFAYQILLRVQSGFIFLNRFVVYGHRYVHVWIEELNILIFFRTDSGRGTSNVYVMRTNYIVFVLGLYEASKTCSNMYRHVQLYVFLRASSARDESWVFHIIFFHLTHRMCAACCAFRIRIESLSGCDWYFMCAYMCVCVCMLPSTELCNFIINNIFSCVYFRLRARNLNSLVSL